MNTFRLDKFPGRQFSFADREYFYFGGTAYLGMQTQQEFQGLLIDNIRKFGSNYGASRLSNVGMDIYEHAEQKLSKWVGSEDALILSSGYLAGQLLANQLSSLGHKLFYGPNTHSSLLIGGHNSYKDFNSLNSALSEHLESASNSVPVLLIDTIDLPDSKFPDFKALRDLPLSQCILVADDSHGLGLVGSEGRGSFKALKSLNPKEFYLCSSLGKALAIPAGAIFGKRQFITELRNTKMFAGASPPPAAYAAALIEAFPIYRKQLKRLLDLIHYFLVKLKKPEAFDYMENYPVFLYKNPELGEFLLENDICTTFFNYPAEEESWQSRIVISAAHTKEDIELLADVINKFYH